MGDSCCRTDYDALFDDRAARRELAEYRRRGPRGTTARLIELVQQEGVTEATVLDIGGGVGVVGSELLRAGAARLTDVDYSRPYLTAARAEIERRGFVDRATFHHGDFVALADTLDDADVVTLDRVVCCYPDWSALVASSVARARRIYALVYPRDRWFLRVGMAIVDGVGRLFGQDYPFRIHPEREIDAAIRGAGFELAAREPGFAWQTVVYRRIGAPASEH
jgi:SAM-dependent methyltransferase